MKNKNAEITIEEVAKMVIAVGCIIVLIILASGLYGIFTKKTELEQARETLKQLVEKIKLLEEGDSGNYLITSPKDWYIISYKKGEDSPKNCFMGNCLCICNDFNINDCDVKGICQKNSDEIKIVELSDRLSYDTVNYFRIKKAATNLIFEKQGEIIQFDISPPLLNDNGFFNEFLDSKSEFLDKGEITIAEQIKYYINSGSAPAFREGNARVAVTKNIQNYFAKYNYPIYVYILPGKGYSQLNINLANLLKISAGKDRSISNDGDMAWPYLIIENPEGRSSSLKNLVVITQIRK